MFSASSSPDANGTPITGAQITVTFFMPAMPAMGMAPCAPVSTSPIKAAAFMKAPVNSAPEAPGTSPISVTKNGERLANKQLTSTPREECNDLPARLTGAPAIDSWSLPDHSSGPRRHLVLATSPTRRACPISPMCKSSFTRCGPVSPQHYRRPSHLPHRHRSAGRAACQRRPRTDHVRRLLCLRRL